MFKITRDSTAPNTTISPPSISVPCFQLTNRKISTSGDNSLSTLTNFTPMFQLEHINEVAETVDGFVYTLSTVPSQYQVVELDVLSTDLIEDLDNLYFNGGKYQNLLSLDEFSFISSRETLTLGDNIDDSLIPVVDSLPMEEREST